MLLRVILLIRLCLNRTEIPRALCGLWCDLLTQKQLPGRSWRTRSAVVRGGVGAEEVLRKSEISPLEVTAPSL